MTEKQEVTIEHLHECAAAYQTEQLDANGFAAVLVKSALQQTPKAIAIVDWVNALWQDYNSRKEAVLADENSVTDFDFSNNSKMPFDFYSAINEA